MYVYLVDDDPLVLASLQATLAGRYETRAFETAEALLAVIDALPPGVALIDMALPGMDGAALQAELTDRQVAMVIVFLTGQGNIALAVDAMRRGAVDFLCKPLRRADLLTALDRATDQLSDLLDQRRRTGAISRLSDREREVLRNLATGAPSKVIAHRLGISSRTVEMHRAHICEKLGVPTAAAIALGCAAGLV
ncbi:MAG: response regulator [Alphaproteobacteria bacterium]|nr:response regulator [Alphaproteobacteria bacterium]MBU1525345.1 response regulator [Alphaproteobacteria bacterium]MBU2352300.1 response regulator [Alphaproteobacteria bacterium]MBU2381658.1 response regulator [Alphaproteobacteria bacterium]